MSFRHIVMAVAVLAGVAVLSGCYRALPTYRYRLTVDVETPDGPRSGSSVIEIRTTDKGRGFPGPEAGGVDQSIKGEAVPVEIAPGVTLFALLTQRGEEQWAAYLMPRLNRDRDKIEPLEDWLNALKRRTDPMVLPFMRPPRPPEKGDRRLWPMLVTFRNNADPRSVLEVDPNDAVATLGHGVKITRITAQITADPVTHQMKKYLPWIDDKRIGVLSGNSTIQVNSDNIYDWMSKSSFIR